MAFNADGSADVTLSRPFGTLSQSPDRLSNRHLFAGYQIDLVEEIYLLGWRWYDPNLAHFLQPDSVVPDPSNPVTLNRYLYANGNPLTFRDPSGHDSTNGSDNEYFDPSPATPVDPIPEPGPYINTSDPLSSTLGPSVNVPLPPSTLGAGCCVTIEPGFAPGLPIFVGPPLADPSIFQTSPAQAKSGQQPSNGKQDPKGGTYTLKDRDTGEVVRTGRSGNLEQRQDQHRRDPITGGYSFAVDRRSDDPIAVRGREQIIYDQYPNAKLNKIRPIALDNPNIDIYLQAGSGL